MSEIPSYFDLWPSCAPKGGEKPAAGNAAAPAQHALYRKSSSRGPAQPISTAPDREPGSESDAEHRILRRLRSAGEPLSTVAAVARASGLNPEVAKRSVADLEARRLVRRTANDFGGERYEAIRR